MTAGPLPTTPEDAVRAFAPGLSARLGVACSGGLDSTTLLHLLHDRFPDRSPSPSPAIVVVHVHHGLRGADADEDARFVRSVAADLGFEAVVHRVAIRRGPPGSLEERARKARYAAFRETVEAQRLTHLLLAHHADDQAESVLMRIRRGAGLRGLRGMAPSRPLTPSCQLVRPLLGVRRMSLAAHARKQEISWRDDASNLDLGFERNRIRHHVLPALERLLPDARERLLRIADLAAAAQDAIEQRARPYRDAAVLVRAPGLLALRRDVLRPLDALTQFHVLQPLFEDEETARRELGRRSFEQLHEVIERASPSALLISGRSEVRIDNDVVWIADPAPAIPELRLEVPGRICWPWLAGRLEAEPIEGRAAIDALLAEARADPRRVVLDRAAVGPELAVRCRRPGDRLRPMGAPGSRLVSDLMQAARIPRALRSRLPVIADERGILWIPGIRPDERGRIGATARAAVSFRWEGPLA